MPKLFTTSPANPRLRHRFWLASLALAACPLTWAATPAAPAGAPARAAAQSATFSAANGSAAADAARQTWQGFSHEELAIDWARWLLSIPVGVNPLAATETGVNCAINQNGPLWFLAAPGGATYNRTCTVPFGAPLVMPVASYIDDYPCPAAFGFQPPPDQSL
jgi:hypothetical protein